MRWRRPSLKRSKSRHRPKVSPRWADGMSPVAWAVGAVGFFASLVTIFGHILPLYTASGAIDWGFTIRYLIWLNGLLLVFSAGALAVIIYRNRRLRRYEQDEFRLSARFAGIAAHLESISAKRTNTIEYLFSKSIDQDAPADQVEDVVHEHCNVIIDNVGEIFRTFTGYKCAVSIKILFEKFDDAAPQSSSSDAAVPSSASSLQYVYTYCRDSLSGYERSRVDQELPEYPYSDNSAFADILDPRKVDFFASNDLLSLGEEYRNSDPNWSRYYNATAVAPIKKPQGIEGADTIGFLCVDNLHGGFDEDFCKSIMFEISYPLYNIFRTLGHVVQSSHVRRRPER